jgi:hypothetical protein
MTCTGANEILAFKAPQHIHVELTAIVGSHKSVNLPELTQARRFKHSSRSAQHQEPINRFQPDLVESAVHAPLSLDDGRILVARQNLA